MAEFHPQLFQPKQEQDPPFPFADSLYCQEQVEGARNDDPFFGEHNSNCPTLVILTDHDLLWEDHEISTLLSKEVENPFHNTIDAQPSLAIARCEAVEWMLKAHTHFSFSLQTAVLGVNYLDRFLFGFKLQMDKPWLTQLIAVACFSLAAKVEETYAPLLLDLQVEAEYLFEAKTVQRMEILVLSTLEWKMNPVTPYTFLDYMTRRLGLKNHLCMEFLGRCQIVLLATVSDSRFMCHLPSVIAAAIMLHVISSVDPFIVEEYQTQILAILGMDKDKVEECGKLIIELELGGKILIPSNKRKLVSIPGSPNGVIDVSFTSDRSNDSWAVASSLSVSSSPEPLAKKTRVDQARHMERFNHIYL